MSSFRLFKKILDAHNEAMFNEVYESALNPQHSQAPDVTESESSEAEVSHSQLG